MQKVAKTWACAKKVILIQDNLNTHNASSFYKNLPANEALKLMERIEMVYTPKKASWLNMVEIEFSALSRQCLDRRIGDIETLNKEVISWTRNRVKNRVKIDWQFNVKSARNKFERHYEKIRNN